MLYNILDQTQRRKVHACNFNQHICAPHPDRILQEHDLLYIKEGNWNIFQDGINYELMAGDVILLQSDHHHYGMVPCTSVVKTCFIHFNSCSGDRLCSDPGEQKEQFVFPMVVHCEKNPLIEHYFNRIIYTYWSKGEYTEKKASAYLDLLLCEISGMKQTSSPHSSIIEDVKITIQKTPERFIKNQELADKYCCSVRTLTSKFKEETGYSLHAWQMKQKCEMANELMKTDGSLTLKEVAATFGFYDEYHFGKSYKKYFGHSPKSVDG